MRKKILTSKSQLPHNNLFLFLETITTPKQTKKVQKQKRYLYTIYIRDSNKSLCNVYFQKQLQHPLFFFSFVAVLFGSCLVLALVLRLLLYRLLFC